MREKVQLSSGREFPAPSDKHPAEIVDLISTELTVSFDALAALPLRKTSAAPRTSSFEP